MIKKYFLIQILGLSCLVFLGGCKSKSPNAAAQELGGTGGTNSPMGGIVNSGGSSNHSLVGGTPFNDLAGGINTGGVDMSQIGGIDGDGGYGDDGYGGAPCSLDCDDDGFLIKDGDCDDEDPERAPGLEETCDNKDNDCDTIIDENLVTGCYDGKDNTIGVGVCQTGTKQCKTGEWKECTNQITPAPDICGSGFDENCNGVQDENCSDIRCEDIDLNSPVHEVINNCLTANTHQKALVYATIFDGAGEPLEEANVRFGIDPDFPIMFGESGKQQNHHYAEINAPRNQGTYHVHTFVACDSDGDGTGDTEVQLNRAVEFNAEKGIPINHPKIIAGGCPISNGNLQIQVLNDETGDPLENVWVMVGPRDQPEFVVSDPSQLGRNPEGENRQDSFSSNYQRTNHMGVVNFLDYSDEHPNRLEQTEPIITVKKENFEIVSIVGRIKSQVSIRLKPLDPSIPQVTQYSGQFNQIENESLDGFASLGVVFAPMSLEGLFKFNAYHLWDGYQCRSHFPNFLLNIPTLTPINAYLPNQREIIAGNLAVDLVEHRYTSRSTRTTNYPLVGLYGEASAFDLASVFTAQGGSIASALGQINVQKIGTRTARATGNTQNNFSISMSRTVDPHPGCLIDHALPDQDVLCLAIGDWSRNGRGKDLFPMGLNSISSRRLEEASEDEVLLPLSTVPANGIFDGIEYLGVAISTRLSGTSAYSMIVDRDFSPNSGPIAATSFLEIPNLSTQGDATIRWNSGSNENSPVVEYCQLDFQYKLREFYSPGDCVEGMEARVIKEIPLWTTFISPEHNELQLPSFPEELQLPSQRSELWNLVEGFSIPDDLTTSIVAKLTCFAKENSDFNFEDFRSDFSTRSASHISSNTITLRR